MKEIESKTSIILNEQNLDFKYEDDKTIIHFDYTCSFDITYYMLYNLSLLYQTANIEITCYAYHDDYVKVEITIG